VLAALGPARGHATVSAAIDDDVCRQVVTALWDDGARQLPTMNLAGYRSALLQRFRNGRIEHRLSQIALDATTKMRLRIVPVAIAELADGKPAEGCAAAIAAWMIGVSSSAVPTPLSSTPGDPILEAPAQRELLAALDHRLASDAGFAARVADAVRRLAASGILPSSSTEGDEHP
jgi:fructuronate reductase